jgi:cytoskeletal protein RodZ
MFEIGNSLREARLRQRTELSAAEQATKIRGKYLRALEDEQFDVLPAETYVRGFLRTYADYLGLDGQLYVDEYNSRFVAGEEEAAQPGRPRKSSARPRRHRRLEASALLAALVGIGVFAALVIAAWKFGGGNPHATSIAGLGQSTRQTSTLPLAVPSPQARPATRLLLTATRGASWVEVHKGSSTGRLLYQGTLDVGQTQRFTARRLWLSVGVPQNLRARVNGHRASLPTSGPVVLLATPTGLRRANAG